MGGRADLRAIRAGQSRAGGGGHVQEFASAYLADRPYPGLRDGINPHHLANARHQLLAQQLIEEIAEPTRGGRRIAILALRDRTRRETAFQRSAARKRLLQTRYLSWASPGSGDPNLIGSAGERIAHASLQAATDIGYRLVRPEGGHVTNLFGAPIPGGPLDNAAFSVMLDNQQLPTAVTILIEVKNVRRRRGQQGARLQPCAHGRRPHGSDQCGQRGPPTHSSGWAGRDVTLLPRAARPRGGPTT